MPIGASKVGALGGLVPGGSETFNASGTFVVPPGVKKVSITGVGSVGNPGTTGSPGNSGNPGTGGSGGGGGHSSLTNNPCFDTTRAGQGGGYYTTNGPSSWAPQPNTLNAPANFVRGGRVATSAANAAPPCCIRANPLIALPPTSNAGETGATGVSGTAGSAGSAGCAGNPGQCSSGLGNNFAGGAGGNAGAAGNAGTAGTGGGGGAGGQRGSPPPTPVASGGSGGTGAGNGGPGTKTAYPTPCPFAGRIKTGGAGGGGAGATNSGASGVAGAGLPGFQRSEGGAGGNTCGVSIKFNCSSTTPGCTNPAWPAPTARTGGTGGRAIANLGTAGFSTFEVMSFGQPSGTGPSPQVQGRRALSGGNLCGSPNPQLACYPRSGAAFRSGSGGGAGGTMPANRGANCNNLTSGGAAGGGGRGNAGNAGGCGGAGGCGAAGTPATFNCVPVIPGCSYPITVASPGGQVVISWNPQ